MDEHEHINFLKPKAEIIAPEVPPPIPVRRRRLAPWMKLVLFGLAILFVGGFLFSYGIARTSPSDLDGAHSLFGSLRRLIGANDRTSGAADDDRINILLLGIGGAGHDGGQLTDTMILGSFKPSTKELGMISVPRDLTVNVPGYGNQKINAVNAYAEMKTSGSGLKASADIINTILGEEVDYTVRVDFKGFEEIIDAIGGVDVYVDKSFTDYQYPILGMEDATCGYVAPETDAEGNPIEGTGSAEVASGSPYGCRYEVLRFTEGQTHMTGETALKYTRSRHGNNGSGSDFDRAARQQKVLLAFKDKALSLGVLLNPGKLQNIVNVVRKNVSTDMSALDMIQMAKYANDISLDKLANHVIDGKSGLVFDSYYGNAYVLLPRKSDWSELHALADNIFIKEEGSNVVMGSAAPVMPSINVEIQNGTAQSGLAGQTAQLLQSSGYGVAAIGNAPEKTWKKTTIFDLSEGKKDTELAALKDYLNADVVMTAGGAVRAEALAPSSILDKEQLAAMTTTENIDFLIILGDNFGQLVFSGSYAP